jgi:hypothetical protein
MKVDPKAAQLQRVSALSRLVTENRNLVTNYQGDACFATWDVMHSMDFSPIVIIFRDMGIECISCPSIGLALSKSFLDGKLMTLEAQYTKPVESGECRCYLLTPYIDHNRFYQVNHKKSEVPSAVKELREFMESPKLCAIEED